MGSYSNSSALTPSTTISTGITLPTEEYATAIQFVPAAKITLTGKRTAKMSAVGYIRLSAAPQSGYENNNCAKSANLASIQPGNANTNWNSGINAGTYNFTNASSSYPFLGNASYAGRTIYVVIERVGTGFTGGVFTIPIGKLVVTTTVKTYTITFTITGNGTATASPPSAASGATVTLTFNPGTGQEVKNVSTSPSLSISNNKFTMPAQNVGVNVGFGNKNYTLTTAVSPSGAGTVTAGGSIAYNSTKSLTATANSGYTFSSWSKTAGSLSSTTANPTTFTMGAGNATVTANFTANNYTLTVAKGTGIASVTGGGTVAYKASTSISATLSTGYNFGKWTSNNGGTFGSATTASTTFVMPVGNTTITANANPKTYTLTVAKGTGISSVSGGGTKGYTTVNAISATASTGYSFKNWTSNNGGTFANANSASTNFTMPNNAVTVTANGQINSYTLTTTVSPSGSGTVTAGGSINYNATKSLTATASSGYTFSSWSKTAGTLSSTTTNPTTFTMGTSAATVTANFTANSYTLTVSKGTGVSSVTGGGSVKYKASASISATLATGYNFNKWTSNNGGTFASATSASTTFTMPVGNTTVTATATPKSYKLTVSKGTGISSVTGGGNSIQYTSVNAITATASTGYSFKNWTSSNGGTFANANSASTNFTMPNNAVTVTANGQINSYTLTTAVSPTGGGTVTAGGSMNYNATKSLTATASSGYSFSSWSKTAGTLSSTTTNPTTFTMGAGAATVTANFTKNSYTLTVSKGTGIASVTGGGSVQYTASTNISATVSNGYTFNKWTSNNGGTFGSATTASTTFTMPVGNTTVTASATANSYTLTVSKGTGISSVTGGGSVQYTTSTAITATASTGYTFKNWTSNNGGTFANANSASTNFTMPIGNTTVTANAQINTYALTVVASPAAGGTVTGGGTFNYNSTNNISATPATGYRFKKWTTTSGTLGNASSASTTLTLDASAATATATFEKLYYTISTSVSPSNAGTLTYSGVNQYGETITLSTTTSTGYQFSSYTTNPTVTITNNQFTMPADPISITANFTKINYNITTVVSPVGAGTISVPSTANYGDTVAISQTPATGYLFDHWESLDVIITNDQFVMPALDIQITAVYVIGASTPSLDKSSYTGGDTALLTIDSASSDYSHRYKLSFGNGMETEWVSVAAGVTGTSIYIPIEWSIHASQTVTTGGILTLETYSSGTLLGSKTVTDLSYTILDNTVPKLRVRRCLSDGTISVKGKYAYYYIQRPESISNYKLVYDEIELNSPASSGIILPDHPIEMRIDSVHDISFVLITTKETITITEQIPKVILKGKKITYI